MSSENILNDPSVTPEPESFDPWRSYHARQRPGEEAKHRFGMTTTDQLHFGYGTQACPGRQVALDLLKMMIASILIGWDVRFPEGQQLPRGVVLDDFRLVRPGSKIEMRRRPAAAGLPDFGACDRLD